MSVQLLVAVGALLCAPALAEGCDNATSCDACTGLGTDCYWCDSLSDVAKDDGLGACRSGGIGVTAHCEACTADDACYKETCNVNAALLWIIVPSVAGGLILIIGIWIWCCCRARKNKNLKTYEYKESKSEARKKAAREERSAARKTERDGRTNDIRAKYGLKGDDYDNSMLGDQA